MTDVLPTRLLYARTRAAWKAIPAAEILSTYLRGPFLRFDDAAFESTDRSAWHPAIARDELAELRAVYGSTSNPIERARIEHRAQQLWRTLVERSIGYAWPSIDLIPWPTCNVPES